MKWRICIRDRELAKELGDPDIGEVEADTLEEAIEKASQDGEVVSKSRMGGLWAYFTPLVQHDTRNFEQASQ